MTNPVDARAALEPFIRKAPEETEAPDSCPYTYLRVNYGDVRLLRALADQLPQPSPPKVHHLGAALRGIADEHTDVLTPRQIEVLYQAASKLWEPQPSPQIGDPNPCNKIFDHKWLDPECVEDGCKSLLPRRLVHEIKEMSPPDDLHTDAWLLGFARARKMAAELVQSNLGPDRAPVMSHEQIGEADGEVEATAREYQTVILAEMQRMTDISGSTGHYDPETGVLDFSGAFRPVEIAYRLAALRRAAPAQEEREQVEAVKRHFFREGYLAAVAFHENRYQFAESEERAWNRFVERGDHIAEWED